MFLRDIYAPDAAVSMAAKTIPIATSLTIGVAAIAPCLARGEHRIPMMRGGRALDAVSTGAGSTAAVAGIIAGLRLLR
jgi:hypothetical protein